MSVRSAHEPHVETHQGMAVHVIPSDGVIPSDSVLQPGANLIPRHSSCKDLFTPHLLGSPASPGRGLIVEGACDACLHLFIAMDNDRDVNAF